VQANLRTAHVILEHLLNNMDILPPGLKAGQRLVDIGSGPLDDEGSESAEDMLEVISAPNFGLAHRLDKIGARKECDPGLQPLLSIRRENAVRDRSVYFRLEVVKDLGCGNEITLYLGSLLVRTHRAPVVDKVGERTLRAS